MKNKKLLLLVINTIKKIDQERSSKCDQIIAKYQKPERKYLFFGPLVSKTYEEAKELAMQEDAKWDSTDEWENATKFAWKQYDMAYKIKALAEASINNDIYI